MKTAPFVEEEFQTVRTIIKNRASISRYGDGELKLCHGKDQVAQPAGEEITRRLREILRRNEPSFMVCIPRLRGRRDFLLHDEKVYLWWSKRYHTDKVFALYSHKVRYWSSFITRSDNAPHIDCADYWETIKRIWEKRDVILCKGDHGKKFDGTGTIFDTADSVKVYKAPKYDAFAEYTKIFHALVKMANDIVYAGGDPIIILSLGPTATVLAYDLYDLGYQALDLGHLGMFYSRTHRNAKTGKKEKKK